MLNTSRLWNPWREMDELRRNVASALPSRQRWSLDWADGPAFNILSGEAGVVLTAELPGFDPVSLEVTAEGDRLTVKGKRDADQTDGAKVILSERYPLEFEKEFRLPFHVTDEHVDALYEKGVLTIRVDRPETAKPRKVDVRTA